MKRLMLPTTLGKSELKYKNIEFGKPLLDCGYGCGLRISDYKVPFNLGTRHLEKRKNT